MLIKYQLRRKKEELRKQKKERNLTVYLLIYRARGPALVDHGAAYPSYIYTVSGFVYICMSIQLHSVGCTVAVYFHCYTFRMSLCLIDYHYILYDFYLDTDRI